MINLLEFHLKNKYYVDVSKSKNGCIAKFPVNYFTEPKIPPQVVEYICRDDEIEIDLGNNKITYPVVDYARKPLIMADIFLKTSFRKLSVKLILLFDGLERVDKFSNILQSPTDEDSLRKEKAIIDSFSDILLGCFNPKLSSDMNEGINQIISLVERGGF